MQESTTRAATLNYPSDLADLMTSAATLVHLKDLGAPLSLNSNRPVQHPSPRSSARERLQYGLSGLSESPCPSVSPSPFLESAAVHVKVFSSPSAVVESDEVNFLALSLERTSEALKLEKELLDAGVSARDTVPLQLPVLDKTPCVQASSRMEVDETEESNAQGRASRGNTPKEVLKRDSKEKTAGDGGVAHFGSPVRGGDRSMVRSDFGQASPRCMGGLLVEFADYGRETTKEETTGEISQMDISGEDCNSVVENELETDPRERNREHRDRAKVIRQGEQRSTHVSESSVPPSLIASAQGPGFVTHSCPGALATAPTLPSSGESRSSASVLPLTSGTLLRMESNARPGALLSDPIEVLALAATQKSLSPSTPHDATTPLTIDLAEPEARLRRQHYKLQTANRTRPLSLSPSSSLTSNVFQAPHNLISPYFPGHYLVGDASTDSLSSSSSLSSRSTTLAEVEDDSDSEELALASLMPPTKRARGKDATVTPRTALEGSISHPAFSSPAVPLPTSPPLPLDTSTSNNFASESSRTPSQPQTTSHNLHTLLTSSASSFLGSTSALNSSTSVNTSVTPNPTLGVAVGASSPGNSQSQTFASGSLAPSQQQQNPSQLQFSANSYGSQYYAPQSLPASIAHPEMTAALSSVHPMFALGPNATAYLSSNSSMIHPMMAAATAYGYAQAQAQAQAPHQVDTAAVSSQLPKQHQAQPAAQSTTSPLSSSSGGIHAPTFLPPPASLSTALTTLPGSQHGSSAVLGTSTPLNFACNGATGAASQFAFPHFSHPSGLSSLHGMSQIGSPTMFDLNSAMGTSAASAQLASGSGPTARSVVFAPPTGLPSAQANSLGASPFITTGSVSTSPVSSASLHSVALGSVSDGAGSVESMTQLPAHLTSTFGAIAQSLPFGAAVMANGSSTSGAGPTVTSLAATPSSPGASGASLVGPHADWPFPSAYLSSAHLSLPQYASGVAFPRLGAASPAQSVPRNHSPSLLPAAAFSPYHPASAHAYAPFYALPTHTDAARSHNALLVSGLGSNPFGSLGMGAGGLGPSVGQALGSELGSPVSIGSSPFITSPTSSGVTLADLTPHNRSRRTTSSSSRAHHLLALDPRGTQPLRASGGSVALAYPGSAGLGAAASSGSYPGGGQASAGGSLGLAASLSSNALPTGLGPSISTNGTLLPSDHPFAYAFRHANSEWAQFNWHVRSGGRYIMTEHAYRRYFACDDQNCRALLYEDSPAPVPEPEDLEEMEYYLPEVRVTIQRGHNHGPLGHRKPCPDLVSRAAFLMRTMNPQQVRDILIIEAGNGIGIPSLDLIAACTEGPAPRRSRFGHGAKRSAHRTPSLLLQMLPTACLGPPALFPRSLPTSYSPTPTLPSPTAHFVPSSTSSSSPSPAPSTASHHPKPSSSTSSALSDPSSNT